jgi:transposase-like protein
MPALSKPGIAWQRIAADYAAGASLSALSRRYGVTRQGIAKRAGREGWHRDPEAVAPASSRTAQRIANPVTPADCRLIADGRRSVPNMQAVLAALRIGAPVTVAARRVGLSDDALRAWVDDDPDFARLAEAARADGLHTRLERLEQAAERGDARIDQWALERHPLTRDEFAAADRGKASLSITVVFEAGVTALDSAAEIRAGDRLAIDAPVDSDEAYSD